MSLASYRAAPPRVTLEKKTTQELCRSPIDVSAAGRQVKTGNR